MIMDSWFLSYVIKSFNSKTTGGDDRVFTLLVRGRETYDILKRIRDSMELSKMASNDQLERLQVQHLGKILAPSNGCSFYY